MTEDAFDETVLEKRGEELARAPALRASDTVTARTLALSADATVPDPRAAESVERALPRISLESPPDGDGSGPTCGSADIQLVATIGEGGMGRVWLARQRSLGRDVAVKTLKSDATAEVSAALLREARITGALEHPGVIPVHALGVDDAGRPLLVMKRVDGVDLETLLADRAHPAWRARGEPLVAAVEILSQLCRTLELAHSRAVVHRDIKPANVMVGSFGEVYLLDWGVARMEGDVQEDALVGTPAFMAPEMVRGKGIDARTDIYLLGATLHEILTGRSRHEGRTVMDVVRAALRSEPFAYDDTVPDELARLCNRACARDPSDRPQTAAAFREGLEDFVRHRSARALTDAALARLADLRRALANEGVPADLAAAYQLATEARFGLVQSLRDHADDPRARGAMREAIALSVELELRQEHADSAGVLLGGLVPPDEELAARVAALRERIAARHRERERLAALERGQDPNVEARARVLPLAILTAVVAVVGAYSTKSDMRTPFGLFVSGTAIVVALTLVSMLLHGRIFGNAFNLRAVHHILLGGWVLVVNRGFGVLENRPIDQIVTVDLVAFAAIIGAAAISLYRGFWIVSASCLLSAWVAYLLPDRAPEVVLGAVVLMFVLCGAVLRRARLAGIR